MTAFQSPLPVRHIRHQWPVIMTLGKAITSSFWSKGRQIPSLPSEIVQDQVPARDAKLVRDFISFVGGEPQSYQGEVPFHMFPQWCIPIGFRNTKGLPFDFKKIINLGVDVRIRGPIRLEEPLILKSWLEDIHDNGRKAVLTTGFITETPSTAKALEARLTTIVPSSGLKELIKVEAAASTTTRVRLSDARIPLEAHQQSTIRVPKNAGLAFAMLTGDFNPLHWLPSYARLLGYRSPILHGYAAMSQTLETLIKTRFGGDPHQVKSFQVTFTNPLPLPSNAGVFISGPEDFYLGAAKGGKAFLVGKINHKEGF